MPNYSIKVQDFEGPLDLLIHLIERDKIDIYDIPIVSVTEQYILYLRTFSEYDIELASEFLVMAATLLQIKSRMLLPKPPVEEGEEADPRQMLIEMLVEYRKIKKQAALLQTCMEQASLQHGRKPVVFADMSRRVKKSSIDELLQALSALINHDDSPTALIERQEFHVQDKMKEIIELLSDNNNSLIFTQILTHGGKRSEKIASFLAILELLRLKRISIRQKKEFSPIYIFLQEVPADVL